MNLDTEFCRFMAELSDEMWKSESARELKKMQQKKIQFQKDNERLTASVDKEIRLRKQIEAEKIAAEKKFSEAMKKMEREHHFEMVEASQDLESAHEELEYLRETVSELEEMREEAKQREMEAENKFTPSRRYKERGGGTCSNPNHQVCYISQLEEELSMEEATSAKLREETRELKTETIKQKNRINVLTNEKVLIETELTKKFTAQMKQKDAELEKRAADKEHAELKASQHKQEMVKTKEKFLQSRDSAKAEKEMLEKEILALKEKICKSESEPKKVTTTAPEPVDVQNLRKELASALSKIGEIPKLRKKLESAQKSLAPANHKAKLAEEAKIEAQQKLEIAEKISRERENEIATMKFEMESKISSACAEMVQKSKLELETAQSDLAAAIQRAEQAETDLREIQQRVEILAEEQTTLTREQHRLQIDNNLLQDQLRDRNSQLCSARAKIEIENLTAKVLEMEKEREKSTNEYEERLIAYEINWQSLRDRFGLDDQFKKDADELKLKLVQAEAKIELIQSVKSDLEAELIRVREIANSAREFELKADFFRTALFTSERDRDQERTQVKVKQQAQTAVIATYKINLAKLGETIQILRNGRQENGNESSEAVEADGFQVVG